MAFSQADRAALRARVEGLRVEVSSLKSAESVAVDEASASIEDTKLLEEIARLEREKSDAIQRTNSASGSVADAKAAMEAAAAKIVDSSNTEQVDIEKFVEDATKPDVLPNGLLIDGPVERVESVVVRESGSTEDASINENGEVA
jgi:hypothetical protein